MSDSQGAFTLYFMGLYAVLLQDFKKGAAKVKELTGKAEVKPGKSLRPDGQISVHQAGQVSQGLLLGAFSKDSINHTGQVFKGAHRVKVSHVRHDRVMWCNDVIPAQEISAGNFFQSSGVPTLQQGTFKRPVLVHRTFRPFLLKENAGPIITLALDFYYLGLRSCRLCR